MGFIGCNIRDCLHLLFPMCLTCLFHFISYYIISKKKIVRFSISRTFSLLLLLYLVNAFIFSFIVSEESLEKEENCVGIRLNHLLKDLILMTELNLLACGRHVKAHWIGIKILKKQEQFGNIDLYELLLNNTLHYQSLKNTFHSVLRAFIVVVLSVDP